MYEFSSFSTFSSTTLAILRLLYCTHSSAVVVVVCIFLVADTVEHLPMGFWPLACLLQRNICWDPLSIYNCFVFLLLHILDTSPLPGMLFANTSSHSVDCVYFFLVVPFAVQRFFFLIHSFILCLLIGIFSPFTFKIIADIIGLISFVLLSAFYTSSNYNGAS